MCSAIGPIMVLADGDGQRRRSTAPAKMRAPLCLTLIMATLATTSSLAAETPRPTVEQAVVTPIATQPAQTSTLPEPATAPVVAPPAAPRKIETTLAIDIDLTRQRMTLTEYGKTVGTWPISSGAEGHRSPTGTFHPLWASKMWFSKKYDNAPMPNAVFFSGGVAMHATQATGMLGHPASHGCIRQSPANAATTYKLVQKHGNTATKITVHGTPHDDEPRLARRESEPRFTALASSSRPATAAAGPGMRRVLLVDADGNRRIAEIPANDPRLIAYQTRVGQMASGRRSYY